MDEEERRQLREIYEGHLKKTAADEAAALMPDANKRLSKDVVLNAVTALIVGIVGIGGAVVGSYLTTKSSRQTIAHSARVVAYANFLHATAHEQELEKNPSYASTFWETYASVILIADKEVQAAASRYAAAVTCHVDFTNLSNDQGVGTNGSAVWSGVVERLRVSLSRRLTVSEPDAELFASDVEKHLSTQLEVLRADDPHRHLSAICMTMAAYRTEMRTAMSAATAP